MAPLYLRRNGQATHIIQRREPASQEALIRRIDKPTGMALRDWRLLAISGVLLVGIIFIALVLLLGGVPSRSVGTRLADDGQIHVSQGIDCRAPANASQAAELGGEPVQHDAGGVRTALAFASARAGEDGAHIPAANPGEY